MVRVGDNAFLCHTLNRVWKFVIDVNLWCRAVIKLYASRAFTWASYCNNEIKLCTSKTQYKQIKQPGYLTQDLSSDI